MKSKGDIAKAIEKNTEQMNKLEDDVVKNNLRMKEYDNEIHDY